MRQCHAGTRAIVRCYARTSIENRRVRLSGVIVGDTFGAFAWSMVIDWSIFLEYGSLMEFDDGWIGHLFLRGSSDD
jgi:hypothetical protein